ncbi:3-methyl-2-oxobutanoate hydroxymethyltransferase [Methylobacillus sp. MM3]|uniref:3-methyl-2-oxobutanoate hydroxymethyltransferase n=1 Tax=Methylobacillus sp. MM3 TaxID=1848039 RepID=UPI0007E02FB4|nr:3-methyl-2-oxobutanoate hydroxymethyltransferase [Methylobacillus sp. MM3]OAJ69600.1 3-methyl-2-oxobutanoate hydroxymethyltransferase [Methylobacillus sp. MM3]
MNLTALQQMAARGEKIAVLTCYDASFAALCEAAGVDVLLVGDSLGMVLQGGSDTLGVTMRDMEYHTRTTATGAKNSYIVADLPYGSDTTPETALENARVLIAAGAHMVKLEGDKVAVVQLLVKNGIPVCAHLGFTPQYVHELGGYKVQGRDEAGARKIMEDAVALDQAGAAMVVLEMMPAALAKQITEKVGMMTIGIGAGPDCDGQVLVLHDMLGIYLGKSPRFVRNFMEGASSIQEAVQHYVAAVKSDAFPTTEHSF